ncbi:MAG: bifunctional oligoribonuclease/PAP phosphatase NrnA [Chloroflexota bacterium]|nr:bifunctional oligoribonuclease/PAP phosphatase NrnA [Chloroflexota bacterium]MDP9471786.1 bifunctional oligoribonuclease/PAP phosphatase NrnA [Chloroflexota bacterium]
MSQASWRLDVPAAEEALRTLKTARTVLMPTHQNVDADGLASPLAIASALAQLGVRAVPVLSDGALPPSLRFLPEVDRVLAYGVDPLPEYDVLCLSDCSDRRRLGRFYADDPSRVDGTIPIVNIDHHVTNDRFGLVNIVEPRAAATAEIVAEILRVWGTELTLSIAQSLLAGIYGDTLGLRTPATTARTMRTAADLVDAGANPAPIVDALFRLKPRTTVCLWQRALTNVQWTGSVIWAELTQDILADCGAEASEAEGLVNFLAGTEGSLVAAILFSNKDGWRVSLRSLNEDVDVAEIAKVFGGGGHPRAAGCQVTGGEEEKMAFLREVNERASTSNVGTA